MTDGNGTDTTTGATNAEQPDWGDWFVNNATGIIIGIAGCWLVIGWLIPLVIIYSPGWIPLDRLQTAGQFGDMFGSVNSLFTGAAFFAALIAVMLQRIELKEAGKRHSRDEIEQTKQMEIAERTLALQLRMQQIDISKMVMTFLVELNGSISRLREAWIDASCYQDVREVANAKARMESAREDVHSVTFNLSMLFKSSGSFINRLVKDLLDLTKDPNQPCCQVGSRTSDLITWFDVSAEELKTMCKILWESQPDLPVGDFRWRTSDNTQKIFLYNKVVSAANQIRDILERAIGRYYHNEQMEESRPEAEIRAFYLSEAKLWTTAMESYCGDLEKSAGIDLTIFRKWAELPAAWLGQNADAVPSQDECDKTLEALFKGLIVHIKSTLSYDDTGYAFEPIKPT